MSDSEVPKTIGSLDIILESCAKAYRECLERFMVSIGANEQNIREYEIRTYPTQDLYSEIWHRGVEIGKVSTRWDVANGYRFIVECKLVPKKVS